MVYASIVFYEYSFGLRVPGVVIASTLFYVGRELFLVIVSTDFIASTYWLLLLVPLFHIWRVLLFICMCRTNIYVGTYLISGFHITPPGGELSALQLDSFEYSFAVCDSQTFICRFAMCV